MFFMEEKLQSRINELEAYRYRDVIELQDILVKESGNEIPNPEVPTDFADFTKEKVGMFWKGWDKYLWLHILAKFPEEWKEKRILGIFDFGKTGGGGNSGFESMLYIEGKPYQGVDSNHQEVFFDQEVIGKPLGLTFRLWSGLEGGGVPREQEHRIKRAALTWLDEKTDDLYYLAKMILDTYRELGNEEVNKHEIMKALNDAFLKIDWSYPGSPEFYASVGEADDFLNAALDGMDKESMVTVNCVGHTHIDLAWLWRLKHTREKASRSFSTVFRLMDMFGEYKFLQTQPQIYEYIKQDFPEIFEEIKRRVKEGRWEADGAMWVEADCNLTSGESLTRQILMGSKFVKEEFGKDMEFLWLPDVFGYSWALPQILKKSGINTFMTTKISWNEFNRMPHDTFVWKGMDGSEILTHFITTPDADYSVSPWYYTYNGMLTPYTVKGVWKNYNDKNINKEVLISFGYGDGGGGVNREALENRRRMDKIPGLPHVKTTTARDYFHKLQETVGNTEEYLHKWDGELYLEYHRGTYTSHAYNKKMNRKLELLYREAEWLTAMSALSEGTLEKAEQDALTEGWKIILRHQFHDIIPGSSILPVYEDSKTEYAQAEEIAETVEAKAFAALINPEENTWTVVNNAGWMQDCLAAVPEGRDGVFKNEAGEILSSQKVGNITYVKVNHVPAMAGSAIYFEEAFKQEEKTVFQVAADRIETPFYVIELNEAGQFTRIYDKENDREVIAEGERANVLQVFEDKPFDFDAWNIDIFYQEKMREVTDIVSAEIVENGNLRAVLRLKWKYMNSKIQQDVIFYAEDRRIDFSTYVNWNETHQLLKASFPVEIRASEARYDIQYGNVKRPNNWNTSWEMAKFETVAHRWVDMSERDYGVSLLNDCKYGHDVKENRMRITLLKSATSPDYKQDQGEHYFTYSLLPHKGDFIEGETAREAYALNQPAKVVPGKWKNSDTSFISFSTDKVELDTVKRSEDGKYLVVRFHEYAGSRQKVKVYPGFAYASFCESDLMERPIEEEREAGEIRMEIKPYEIKTILFTLK